LTTTVCPVSAKTLDRHVNASAGVDSAVNPLIGATIAGKYYVHRLIGAGAMGEVFEAENRLLRRMVALKIVRGAIASPEAIARLEREALLVAAVQHPNICDVYDCGTLSDGSPFIVLERLFGETLGQLMARTARPRIPLLIDLFTQMLSGLQAAHGAQIVHRDLKPQNVFLADRLGCAPLVKLLDFGLARDVSGVRTRTITKPGALVGTLKYMSPEQLRGVGVDARADLFAVGVMLYEALSGHHPFEGSSIGEVQTKILRGDHVPFLELRSDLPIALGDVIDRCLAKSPDERWAAAADLQRALSRAIGNVAALGESVPPSGDPPSSTFG
jgi:eukaryotic-like serine/threonine-protein kinase